MAAAFFAGVMAFEQGGIVPGFGKGDTVPAMLSPGEGVLNKKMMDLLNQSHLAGTGYFPASVQGTRQPKEPVSSTNHFNTPITYAPVIHAIDGTGVEKLLKKHDKVFQTHVRDTLRKMNL